MDDDGINRLPGEHIEGAPPAISRSELRRRRRTETITLNRYLYEQTQGLQQLLLGANDLMGLLEVLLVTLPRQLAYRSAELWLYDPDASLAQLIVGGERYGRYLQLLEGAAAIEELYAPEPDVELITATDSRMFEVLKTAPGIDRAMLVPLLDNGRLVGSLHLGLEEGKLPVDADGLELFGYLGDTISRCFSIAVAQEQVSQLATLDSLTGVSNQRGFERDIQRELARARRAGAPVSLLVMEIDEYAELHEHYGEVRGHFVLKKVAERISSDLRATDLMARLLDSRMAVLVPASGDLLAREIAERMRRDVQGFAIDDGRGAVLQVTLSCGVVSWSPEFYPARDMQALARQMEDVAVVTMATARAAGGNRVFTGALEEPPVAGD